MEKTRQIRQELNDFRESLDTLTAKEQEEKIARKIEKLKYEIADEMGVLDKVIKDGWKSLSAKETGRIGGLMTKKKKHKK